MERSGVTGEGGVQAKGSKVKGAGPDRWLVAIVALSVVAYAGFAGFVAATERAVDYHVFVIASQALLGGTNIYVEPDAYARYGELLGISNFAPPYRYPLLTALVLTPLSFLPVMVSDFLWVFASGLAALCSALLLSSGLSPVTRRIVLVLSLTFVPIWTTLHAGQINTWTLLLTATALYFFQRNRETTGGTLLMIAIFVKPFPIFLAGLLIIQRRWSALGAMVLTAAAILILGLAVYGPAASLSQFDFVSGNESTLGRFNYPTNQSLNGLVSRQFVELRDGVEVTTDLNGARLFAVALMAVVGAITFGTLALRFGREHALLLQAGLVLSATHLLFPNGWYHHLAMLLLGYAALIRNEAYRAGSLWRWSGLIVSLVLFAVFGLAWKQLALRPPLVEIGVVGQIMVFGLLVAHLVASKPAGGRTPLQPAEP